MHKLRHAQNLEQTTISNPSSVVPHNGEGDPANMHRALAFRPKDTSFQTSRSTEDSGDQPSDAIVNEAQFNFNAVHKQTQDKSTTQIGSTQYSTIPRDDDEVSFRGKLLRSLGRITS